jgi:hypothetical protein
MAQQLRAQPVQPAAQGIGVRVVKLPSPLFGLALAFMAARLMSQTASADPVTWNVDPTNSYIRLTIPDQSVTVSNVGSVTFQMRDASDNNQWTDAGGRRASLDGQLVTDYADGTSITFLSNPGDIYALETTSLRPNPADWDAATTNYTGTSTAPAALGGRVRGNLIVTFDAAYAAFRSVQLVLSNAAPGAIPITSGMFAANTTSCGIASALSDVDGLALPYGLGQPIPDLLNTPLEPLVGQNAAGGTIANLGGLNRQLTYTINLPNLSIDLSGTVVTGSAAGLIIASAVIPAPPAPTLSARLQGGDLVLTWPTNTTGFVLEFSTNLPATDWMLATPPPTVVNGENVVTNAITGAAAFYRLHLQ